MNQWQFFWSAGVATAALVLAATPALAEALPVTGVELQPNNNGTQVILSLPNGEPPQVLKTRSNNTLTLYILNAQLRLPNGQDFRAGNPAVGIESVTVTQANAVVLQKLVEDRKPLGK